MIKNKKSEAGIVIVVVIIVVLFIGWVINISQRECKSNKECGSESYCGSDFSCHQYPTIQKTVVEYSLLFPSIIIGAAILIAAFIVRRRPINQKEEIKEIPRDAADSLPYVPQVQEVSDISEPYYKSNGDIESP